MKTDLTPHALILEHGATPIIDAACEALAGTGWVIWSEEVKDRARDDACVILRAALPWEPSTETILAMAHAYSTDWDSANLDQRHWWELKSIDAYQAQPIMRELYPERFNVVA